MQVLFPEWEFLRNSLFPVVIDESAKSRFWTLRSRRFLFLEQVQFLRAKTTPETNGESYRLYGVVCLCEKWPTFRSIGPFCFLSFRNLVHLFFRGWGKYAPEIYRLLGEWITGPPFYCTRLGARVKETISKFNVIYLLKAAHEFGYLFISFFINQKNMSLHPYTVDATDTLHRCKKHSKMSKNNRTYKSKETLF